MVNADDVAYPIAWPDAALWRRQSRSLFLTFIGLPLLLSVCMWSVYLGPRPVQSAAELLVLLQNNLWGAQIILSLWLGLVVSMRSAGTIAHLRETGNWTLVKIMPYELSEIYRQKAAAVEHSLRWPIYLVLVLRAACILLGFFSTPANGPFAAPLSAVFLLLFCAELQTSIRYNCSVGLLASTYARTTANAQGLMYLLQGGLFIVLFAPLWWSFLNLGGLYGNGSLALGGGELAFSVIALYSLLSIVQAVVTCGAYSLAIRHALKLAE